MENFRFSSQIYWYCTFSFRGFGFLEHCHCHQIFDAAIQLFIPRVQQKATKNLLTFFHYSMRARNTNTLQVVRNTRRYEVTTNVKRQLRDLQNRSRYYHRQFKIFNHTVYFIIGRSLDSLFTKKIFNNEMSIYPGNDFDVVNCRPTKNIRFFFP